MPPSSWESTQSSEGINWNYPQVNWNILVKFLRWRKPPFCTQRRVEEASLPSPRRGLKKVTQQGTVAGVWFPNYVTFSLIHGDMRKLKDRPGISYFLMSGVLLLCRMVITDRNFI